MKWIDQLRTETGEKVVADDQEKSMDSKKDKKRIHIRLWILFC